MQVYTVMFVSNNSIAGGGMVFYSIEDAKSCFGEQFPDAEVKLSGDWGFSKRGILRASATMDGKDGYVEIIPTI